MCVELWNSKWCNCIAQLTYLCRMLHFPIANSIRLTAKRLSYENGKRARLQSIHDSWSDTIYLNDNYHSFFCLIDILWSIVHLVLYCFKENLSENCPTGLEHLRRQCLNSIHHMFFKKIIILHKSKPMIQ